MAAAATHETAAPETVKKSTEGNEGPGPPWCSCIALVEFDVEKGPLITYEYPRGVVSTRRFLTLCCQQGLPMVIATEYETYMLFTVQIHSEQKAALAHLSLPEGMSGGTELESIYCIRFRK